MNHSLAFGAPENSLTCTQWMPASIEEVFPFFEDPHNLQKITPPEMGFHILSVEPNTIQTGTRIVYRLRWMGIPYQWHTLIQEWVQGAQFVDTQERGPYILWHHTHTFEVCGKGVLMTDTVRYRVPFGWLGVLAHRLIVRSQVEAIFEFRRKHIAEFFSAGNIYTQMPDSA